LTTRGSHPDDARLFGAPYLPRLRAAAQEVAWLIDRGYPRAGAIAFVSDHRQLEDRQRLALERSVCSDGEYRRRAAREEEADDVAGRTLHVDALNLIVTLEVALSGGLVLTGADGAVRDLAGLRASYGPVPETEEAIDRVGVAMAALRVGGAVFYLDAPLPSSADLRTRLLVHALRWACPVDVQLVRNPDASLAGARHVVSSDGPVLEACASWLNLGARIVERIANVRSVKLQ
jgi:hypothetical protein